MGEAKRRRLMPPSMVYHHTSSLRTNMIWMSGVIKVEGASGSVFHPHFGEILPGAMARRNMVDFPPVAWFTKRIAIPRCLTAGITLCYVKETGEMCQLETNTDQANRLALQRIAIGFPIADIPVVPWPEHSGYNTGEGKELNETARECGDDPDDWYVSEEPVDVLKSTEVWAAETVAKPRLKKLNWYLNDVHSMVRRCREDPRVQIMPSWMTEDHPNAVLQKLNQRKPGESQIIVGD